MSATEGWRTGRACYVKRVKKRDELELEVQVHEEYINNTSV
jgi:hypothetical protein